MNWKGILFSIGYEPIHMKSKLFITKTKTKENICPKRFLYCYFDL